MTQPIFSSSPLKCLELPTLTCFGLVPEGQACLLDMQGALIFKVLTAAVASFADDQGSHRLIALTGRSLSRIVSVAEKGFDFGSHLIFPGQAGFIDL